MEKFSKENWDCGVGSWLNKLQTDGLSIGSRIGFMLSLYAQAAGINPIPYRR